MMNDERQQRIKLLMDRAEAFVERAQEYRNPAQPRWRRVIGVYRAAMALRRAVDLMDEVAALSGRPRPAEKWLGMGRAGWQRAQFALGVVNAWSGIDSAMKGQWFLASVSFVCVIVTAHWRLPYKPPRLQ